MMVVLPFKKQSDHSVEFRIHSEGKTFSVRASDGRGVAEVYARGFDSTQGFVSALSAAQRHARSLGVEEPMRIEMMPSQTEDTVIEAK